MAENSRSSLVSQSATTRASDVSARLQHLRNLLSSERHGHAEQRRAMEALDREMEEMSGEPISARLDRRRRELEAQIGEHDPLVRSESPTSSPSSLARSRRRAVRPSERLLRHRERLNLAQETVTDTNATIERLPPPIEPSEVAIQEYLDEAQVNRENRWRAKRRKLDDGTFEEEPKTFSYGYKGQVVPGPLKMEIVSCDGGEYSEPNVGSSMPQHVLQDDATVYCTKSNRCNMLLKHVGGMPISLTKLVIKGPDNGYDAPIQEGMIFIAMDDDKLLEKTEQYEVRYSPRNYRYHHRRPDHSELRLRPSRDYLNSTRSPLRSIDRSSYLRDPYPPREPDETDRLLETALVPGFNVTTQFDDSSDAESSTQRESWYSSTSPFADFNPYVVRTYVDDNYRPTYDRIAFSDGSGSSSESDHEGSASERNQPAPRSPRLISSPRRRSVADREREHEHRLAQLASSSRPISRHGIPADPYADMQAATVRQRQQHSLNRMRVQQAYDSRDGGDWDRWTREYFRMEMEHRHGTHRNRRSTPSRIEIREPMSASGTASGPVGRGDGTSESRGWTEPQEVLESAAGSQYIIEDAAANGITSLHPASRLSTPTVKPATPNTATAVSPPVTLAPHARFFIRRDKSSVAIKFDPPVAGRYLLIKLWAPCPNANIDIQSIVAHGYGGPRFFPSREFR